jgi:hypothetical protein
LLADYIILAHGHWLLRALIAWVMADVIYCALIGNIGAL